MQQFSAFLFQRFSPDGRGEFEQGQGLLNVIRHKMSVPNGARPCQTSRKSGTRPFLRPSRVS